MAETETGGTAVAEETFQYDIKVEDAGPATKKVHVSIPQDRVDAKLDEQFKEIRSAAALPGFRPGKAPRKLVEKKFSSEIKDQVRRSLISESYEQAVEKNNLQPLGEPEIDKDSKLDIGAEGGISYSFTVEVQPEFTLPDFSGLTVKKPKVDVTEANVDQAMQNLREQQGTLVPVEGRNVQSGDYITADVHIKDGDNVVGHSHDAQIVVRPGRVGGFQIDDLDKQLEGLAIDQTKTITVTAPADFANEALRGKTVGIEFKLKDIKALELAELTPDFLESLGFNNIDELRSALREQLVERVGSDVQNVMRQQVAQYLLQNVQMQLPEKMTQRQQQRIVQRRAVDLLRRGVPAQAIQQNLEALRGGADVQAVNELKLFFMLQKVANDAGVEVDEDELNGQVAMMAIMRGLRPEKFKQQMAKEGTLAELYLQLREGKAMDTIIEKAKVEEVEAPNPTAPAGGEQHPTPTE